MPTDLSNQIKEELVNVAKILHTGIIFLSLGNEVIVTLRVKAFVARPTGSDSCSQISERKPRIQPFFSEYQVVFPSSQAPSPAFLLSFKFSYLFPPSLLIHSYFSSDLSSLPFPVTHCTILTVGLYPSILIYAPRLLRFPS